MNYKDVAALNKAQWAKAPRPMRPVPEYLRNIPPEDWTERCIRGQERQRENEKISEEWQDRWVQNQAASARRFFWGVIF